ncbi:MAG: AAA family ATPase, partial [Myxococcota bacterium]
GGTRILEARCPAYGKAIPFLPILEFLRDSFAIAERDSDQLVREKIAGRLLLLDRAFEESLPLIFDFLGVPDPDRPGPKIDPEVRQRRLFAFVRRLVQAQSEREPAVILFDDIHWIDAASDGFLAQLVEAIGTTRTLLLMNFRPEYGADWFQRSYYQRLPVSPLGRADVAAMVAHLLGTDASVAPLPALIMERTRGNPFFTEEVVQSLVESGALEGEPGAYRLTRATEDLEVPATVQALLAARIDRLPEQDKQVLHTAAVIGRQFGELLLSAVINLSGAELTSALGRLQAGEFILEQAVYPVAEYIFKHPLTEQVARESQLQERRGRLHASVARAIEEAGSEKLDEQAALIGHHWEQAGEAPVAARWYGRAAGLVGLSDLARGAELWGKVRELASRDASDAEADRLALEACFQLLNLGWRTGLDGEQGRVLLDAALVLGERCGERELPIKAAVAFYVLLLHRGDVRECVKVGREALALAEAVGDPDLVAAASYARGEGSAARGDLADGLFHLDQALEFFDRHPSPVMAGLGFYAPAHARMLRGSEVLVSLGRLQEGFEDLERVLDLAAHEASPEQLSFVVGVLCWQARWHPEPAVVVAHAERALAATQKIGNRYLIGPVLAGLGMARLAIGEPEEAIAHLEEGLSLVRKERFVLFAEPSYVSALARSHLAVGDATRAHKVAAEAVAIAERRGTLFLEADAQLALSQVLRAERGQAARSAIDRALARARTLIGETGGRSLLPLVYEEEAALAAFDGDDSARERHLREAHRLFTVMGATRHAQRVARELGL